MAKNIVVCCDGTANEFARDKTNVVKLLYAFCTALVTSMTLSGCVMSLEMLWSMKVTSYSRLSRRPASARSRSISSAAGADASGTTWPTTT
jgi:hypothetical protein